MTHPLESFDFEALYRGSSQGMGVAFEVPPWDIGKAQPEVVRLVENGDLQDEILDAGCGLGDNAILLAQRGHRVTGVDGAPTAIAMARERARLHGVDIHFVQADATALDGIKRRYRTVVDSALYHCLGDQQRHAYAAALHRVTLPEAQLHLFCVADVGEDHFPLSVSVSQDDLHEHLIPHWRILSVEQVDYYTAMMPEQLYQLNDAVGGTGQTTAPAEVRTDEQGHVLGRMWHLHAQRK